MRRVRALVAATIAMVTLGCEGASPLGLPRNVADFDEMRALWDAEGIDNYDIDLSVGTEVTVEVTIRFEVRNSLVTRVFEVGAGWRVPTADERRLAIDSLYTRMAEAKADPSANVVTLFDTRNGLLTYSSIDRPTLVDDAYWYTVRRFTRR